MKVNFVILIILLILPTLFAQWTNTYNNNDVYFRSVFMGDEDNGFAVGSDASYTNGIIYATTNGGRDWFNIPGIGNVLRSVWFSAPNIGFAVGNYGTIVKTTDGGSSWTSKESGTNLSLTSIFFISADIGWVVGGHRTKGVILLKTNDQGETWIEKTTSEVGVLDEVYFVNEQVGFAVGSEQIWTSPMTDRPILIKTTNGGESWQSLSAGISDCQLRTVFFNNETTGWIGGAETYNHPNNPNVVLLKTADGGATWQSVVLIKLGVINSIRMSDTNHGWACGYGDVWGNQYGLNYSTSDGGTTWTHETQYNDVKLNNIFLLNNSIGWGTAGAKMYKYENTTDVDKINLPLEFSLSQNFPNPFNPVTKIEFTIPIQSHVSLTIFDVLGREVMQLIDDEMQEGVHSVDFDAAALTSGVYLFKLKTDSYVEIKKMSLIK